MGTADDLALEREFVAVLGVEGGDALTGAICEAADAEGGDAFADIASNGVEMQRSIGVEMGYEANAVCLRGC